MISDRYALHSGVLPIRKTSLKMVVKSRSEVNRHPGLLASILDGQNCASSRVTGGSPHSDKPLRSPDAGGRVIEDRMKIGTWCVTERSDQAIVKKLNAAVEEASRNAR